MPSILGKRVSQKEYDRATSKNKKRRKKQGLKTYSSSGRNKRSSSSSSSPTPSKQSYIQSLTPGQSQAPVSDTRHEAGQNTYGEPAGSRSSPAHSDLVNQGFTHEGAINADPKGNKSPFGEFVQGVGQGLTLGGEQLVGAKDREGTPTVGEAGALVGAIGGLALEGLGAEVAALKVGAWIDSLKAMGMSGKRVGLLARLFGKSKGVESLNKIGKLSDVTIAGNRIKQIAVNSKTLKGVDKILKSKFTRRALTFGGGWVGAVTLGLWGQAESAEPLDFFMNKELIDHAQATGDWSLYDEADAMSKELMDLKTWEKIGILSPISPFIGIPNKIKGGNMYRDIRNRFADKLKVGQEDTEISDVADPWLDLACIKSDMDREDIDYFNEQRRVTDEMQRDADATQARELAAMWMQHQKDLDKMEREQAKWTEQFWLDYYKAKLATESTPTAQSENTYEPPSKLNFGLL